MLVVKLSHHGDALLCAPVFTTLKRQFPHLELDALVYAETRDMLAGQPALAELHSIDRRWQAQGLTTRLRAENAWLSGDPERVRRCSRCRPWRCKK